MVLICGDCLKEMQGIEAGSVDLVLCDPPYGTTACKWDAVIPFEPMWREVWRVLKPNGAAVFTASQPFTSALIMSQIDNFKYEWIWSKNKGSGHLNANKMPMKYHENILVFSRNKNAYFPQNTENHIPMNFAINKQNSINNTHGSVISGGSTTRKPRSIIEIKVVNNDGSGEGRFHPTQKPIALMEYLIKTYTVGGETVLDFTMGSGTTGVAAANLDRRFIGIERDPSYFKIAEDRIEKANLAWY